MQGIQLTKDEIDDIFVLPEAITNAAVSYRGAWTTTSIFTITFEKCNFCKTFEANANPNILKDTIPYGIEFMTDAEANPSVSVIVRESSGLRNVDDRSLASKSVSPAVTGDWGKGLPGILEIKVEKHLNEVESQFEQTRDLGKGTIIIITFNGPINYESCSLMLDQQLYSIFDLEIDGISEVSEGATVGQTVGQLGQVIGQWQTEDEACANDVEDDVQRFGLNGLESVPGVRRRANDDVSEISVELKDVSPSDVFRQRRQEDGAAAGTVEKKNPANQLKLIITSSGQQTIRSATKLVEMLFNDNAIENGAIQTYLGSADTQIGLPLPNGFNTTLAESQVVGNIDGIGFFEASTQLVSITSVEAHDPDNRDNIYSAEDVITISFDAPTSMPNIGSKSLVDAVFEFYQDGHPIDLGTDYDGEWSDKDTATIRLRDVSGSSSNEPKIGKLVVRMRENVLTVYGASTEGANSVSFSDPIEGDWGSTHTLRPVYYVLPAILIVLILLVGVALACSRRDTSLDKKQMARMTFEPTGDQPWARPPGMERMRPTSDPFNISAAPSTAGSGSGTAINPLANNFQPRAAPDVLGSGADSGAGGQSQKKGSAGLLPPIAPKTRPVSGKSTGSNIENGGSSIPGGSKPRQAPPRVGSKLGQPPRGSSGSKRGPSMPSRGSLPQVPGGRSRPGSGSLNVGLPQVRGTPSPGPSGPRGPPKRASVSNPFDAPKNAPVFLPPNAQRPGGSARGSLNNFPPPRRPSQGPGGPAGPRPPGFPGSAGARPNLPTPPKGLRGPRPGAPQNMPGRGRGPGMPPPNRMPQGPGGPRMGPAPAGFRPRPGGSAGFKPGQPSPSVRRAPPPPGSMPRPPQPGGPAAPQAP
eukprot:gene22229-12694_t